MTDIEQTGSEEELIVPQDILEYDTDYEIGQDNVDVMGLKAGAILQRMQRHCSTCSVALPIETAS